MRKGMDIQNENGVTIGIVEIFKEVMERLAKCCLSRDTTIQIDGGTRVFGGENVSRIWKRRMKPGNRGGIEEEIFVIGNSLIQRGYCISRHSITVPLGETDYTSHEGLSG